MSEQKSLQEAMQDLKDAARPIFEPPPLRMVEWIDRQLRRSPRLYR
jgi:hypothetical protein